MSAMICKPIPGLVLDDKSKAALKRIQKIITSGNYLASAISVGVFSNIFSRSSVPQASYNVTQTDWYLYAQAMKAVPIIVKSSVQKEIELMVIEYELNYNAKHLQFWKGMYNGCTQK